jgi:hypothetical protein
MTEFTELKFDQFLTSHPERSEGSGGSTTEAVDPPDPPLRSG